MQTVKIMKLISLFPELKESGILTNLLGQVVMAQFNSGYTSSEIMAMQRDAEKRVREMQKKSEEKVKGSNKGFDLPQNGVMNILKNIEKAIAI